MIYSFLDGYTLDFKIFLEYMDSSKEFTIEQSRRIKQGMEYHMPLKAQIKIYVIKIYIETLKKLVFKS